VERRDEFSRSMAGPGGVPPRATSPVPVPNVLHDVWLGCAVAGVLPPDATTTAIASIRVVFFTSASLRKDVATARCA